MRLTGKEQVENIRKQMSYLLDPVFSLVGKNMHEQAAVQGRKRFFKTNITKRVQKFEKFCYLAVHVFEMQIKKCVSHLRASEHSDFGAEMWNRRSSSHIVISKAS